MLYCQWVIQMIILNEDNFAVSTMQKSSTDVSAPKSTFYADFKICLALEGEAVWEIENRSYTITPGDIIFLNIGQKRTFTAFGKDGFQLCVFTLNRNAFSGLHHFMYFLERVKSQENRIQSQTLSLLLKEIYEEWQGTAPFSYELASAKLTEFFVKAERADAYSFHPVDYEMLGFMDYMDANITKGVTLSAVAKKAGLSESAFSRRFSALNGISFKQYVVEKRIQLAIELLQTTNRKMIDIALDSGFDSISGFYAAFKKKTGTTPNKFCAQPD